MSHLKVSCWLNGLLHNTLELSVHAKTEANSLSTAMPPSNPSIEILEDSSMIHFLSDDHIYPSLLMAHYHILTALWQFSALCFRCKIVDKHLEILAAKHIEAKFIKIDAEKAKFLTERLNVRVLPTMVLLKENKTVSSHVV